MKKKLLFSLILTAGLLAGNFSGYQAYGQTPAQTKTVKTQTVKYTCPMHPQVIKDIPGNCPICGMELKVKRDNKNSGMMGDSAMMQKNHSRMMHDPASMKKGHMTHDTATMRKDHIMMRDTTSMKHKKMGK